MLCCRDALAGRYDLDLMFKDRPEDVLEAKRIFRAAAVAIEQMWGSGSADFLALYLH